MRHPIALLVAVLALAGCASSPAPVPEARTPGEVTPFSRSKVGAQLPIDWQSLVISRAKQPTRYETVFDPLTQRTVLRARADRACTGLKQRVDVDPHDRPLVAWEWRVMQLIEGADNTDRRTEDSPVRLLLFFDGDRRALPIRDQMALDLAQLASGAAPPFATLIYIWENRQPVGTVIESAYTGQVKMIVAGSGGAALGGWKKFERNYVTDYWNAFGRAPGRLIGVGILTDSDNTGAKVEAFYGDIRLLQP
jgi:hypothetical protein